MCGSFEALEYILFEKIFFYILCFLQKKYKNSIYVKTFY